MFEAGSEVPRFEADEAEGAGRAPGELTVSAGGARLPLPLASVDYRARVSGVVADVTLTQVFENSFDEPLEATYIFPLSGGAAVRSFELRVAGRTIRGEVRERGEARAEYRRAVDEGRRAAIVEQERDDVFTVQVGNLPPGERATVVISYCERLDLFDGGRTELRLPLVVAPRYVPGTPLDRANAGAGVADDTDAVPDASRVTPPRLAAGSSAGPSVSIEVEIDAGAGPVADLACSQHATSTALGAAGVAVRLSRADERADRDFVLRWRVEAADVRPSLSVYRDPEKGLFGMLTVLAPEARRAEPRDVVFLLDRSGSMGGAKMRSAARACSILLESLTPADRFAVAAFDDRVEWLDDGAMLAADEAGVARGRAHLRSIAARGGTEIDAALADAFAALGRRRDARGRLAVVVLVTDGQVADEHRALARVGREIGDGRLFAVGVDTAVNGAFLDRLARTGRGTSSLVEPGAQLEGALAHVAREIGSPALTDLSIEDLDAGVLAAETAPSRLPDLFAGRPVTVFLRLESPGALRLAGRRADGAPFSETVRAQETDLAAVAHLWARARVEELEDAFRAGSGDRDRIRKEIVDLAIAHAIVTRFTAYLAVDEEVVVEGGTARRVTQPVSVPAEWNPAFGDAPDADATFVAMPVACAPPPPPTAAGGLMGRMFSEAFSAADRIPESREEVGRPAPGGHYSPAPTEQVTGTRQRPSGRQRRELLEGVDALAARLRDAVDRAGRKRWVRLFMVRRARNRVADLLDRYEFGPACQPLASWLEREWKVVERILGTSAYDELAGAARLVDELTQTIVPELKRRMAADSGDPGSFWEATV